MDYCARRIKSDFGYDIVVEGLIGIVHGKTAEVALRQALNMAKEEEDVIIKSDAVYELRRGNPFT